MNLEISQDSAPKVPALAPEELARLPIRKYGGPIRLIASEQDLAGAAQVIRLEKVVGLDTETQPAFRKGQSYLPSLVQIATSSMVYLFQLKKAECSLALAETLENAAIVKAGVGLADDFKSLQKVFPFTPQNAVDLSVVARAQGFQKSGVRSLAGQLLGFRVTKGFATSNWARPSLSQKQIAYAATDAWVCRELFLRFQQLGFLDPAGQPVPVQPEENPPG